MPHHAADWIAVDWGTSTLRAWAMSDQGNVLHHATSTDGMATIAATGGHFESALLSLVSPWLPTTRPTAVIACGMVGARQGWHEVPYHAAPCTPQSPLTKLASTSPAIDVHILSGISQLDPPDVMRGEETQIAGLLHSNPDFESAICLPGTHSKWVAVRNGQIEHFRTFQTGELFELLANHSVLNQTLAPEGFDQAGFLAAYHATRTAPHDFLSQTFSLRPSAILHGLSGIASRSRLSGHLIGLELAGVKPPAHVALIGTPHLTSLYRLALESSTTTTTIHDPDQTTLDGLRAAYATLRP